jgi:hypothetical protein
MKKKSTPTNTKQPAKLMQSDSTTNCEEQMKYPVTKQPYNSMQQAKQNDEEEINSYRKTTLHALDAAEKQNKNKK